jgi:acyl carrier protein
MSITSEHPAKTSQSSNDLLPLIRQVGEGLRMRPELLRKLHLDSSFDKDLGLDSLSRMEMLARVEEYFGVALPEEVYARIETPRDLWREIQQASPQQQLKPELFDSLSSKQNESDAIAYDAQTLVDVLEWSNPSRTHSYHTLQ